ncbi:MAG: LysM domain-containing protein [Betaproteobacteria bacterium]|nr:LysM domain-containing protein [Betaproteobacteria bacterium]
MAIHIDSNTLSKTEFLTQKNSDDLVRLPISDAGSSLNFSRVLGDARSTIRLNSLQSLPPDSTVVKSGDTLSGIVKQFLNSRGVNPSTSDIQRLAQDVAQASGIQNANRIYPGQRIALGSLHALLPGATPNLAALDKTLPQQSAGFSATVPTPANGVESNSLVPNTQLQLLTRIGNQAHPILQKTLDRAVEKGFIPPKERQAVYDRILQMATEYKFSPDDFARMTLMESDGMNPKASNSRCHGIIQFCDGPDRGAASVGFGQNPKAIMNKSVLQQLDLVAKYFDDTGLKNMGPAGLDDLYLTVLTPAARQETRQQANLNIPGNQAAQLYVNRDVRAGITRQSILQGLHQNANERLGLDTPPTVQPVSGNVTRVQALKVSAYTNVSASVTR